MHRRAIWPLVILAAGAFALWLAGSPDEDAPGPSILERSAETARMLPEPDLPPEGTRSLFDHLVAQADGLPYPFEALVEMLQRQAPVNAQPVSVMIPLGRSLLKAQADFERPRVLVAADYHAPNSAAALGITPRGQLFLGFVENAREIEVISYNELAGRYEFQLVQDYAEDGQRRIVYARRAVCTTCHQRGTPIFPQRPWNETNAQPGIAERIVQARAGAPYLGLALAQPLAAPERFDELTDVGALVTATQRLWREGCGESAPCRRQMLALALRHARDPGGFDEDTEATLRLRRLQAQHWPETGIAVPESDIRNRDPLLAQPGWGALLREALARAPRPRSNEDLAAFDRLPRLPAEVDPLTPRPPRRVLHADDLDGVYGIAALFTADDLHLLEVSTRHDWQRVEAAVEALPDEFFAAPFSRVRTLQALLAHAGRSIAYCCLDVSEMSPPVAITEPPLALAEGSPLTPFADYCFACHRGNPSARLDFMAGADEAEVAARIRDTASIRDALDWPRYLGTDKAATLMPPADSAERAQLEADLAQNPDLLERMRRQVPGLFDF